MLEIKCFDFFLLVKILQNMTNFAKARLDSFHILSFVAILISSIKVPSCTTLWFIIPKDVVHSISEIHFSLNLQHVFTLRAFRRNCLEKTLWGACNNDAVLKNTQTTCGESLTTLLCFVFFPGLWAFCSPLLLVSKTELTLCCWRKNNCILSNSLVGFQFLTRRVKLLFSQFFSVCLSLLCSMSSRRSGEGRQVNLCAFGKKVASAPVPAPLSKWRSRNFSCVYVSVHMSVRVCVFESFGVWWQAGKWTIFWLQIMAKGELGFILQTLIAWVSWH